MIGDIQKGGMQTSFIPKKPLISYGGSKPAYSGIFTFITIIVCVVAFSVLGGGYAYKIFLQSQIKSINSQLESIKTELENRRSFMNEIVRFDTKLKNAGVILDRHISLKQLFTFLEERTMQNLRFSEFNYTNKDNTQIELRLGGEAESYSTIALQEKEFFNSKRTGNNDFSDVVFSDLNPGLTGDVVFKLTASVRPDLILYSNKDMSTSLNFDESFNDDSLEDESFDFDSF